MSKNPFYVELNYSLPEEIAPEMPDYSTPAPAVELFRDQGGILAVASIEHARNAGAALGRAMVMAKYAIEAAVRERQITLLDDRPPQPWRMQAVDRGLMERHLLQPSPGIRPDDGLAGATA